MRCTYIVARCGPCISVSMPRAHIAPCFFIHVDTLHDAEVQPDGENFSPSPLEVDGIPCLHTKIRTRTEGFDILYLRVTATPLDNMVESETALGVDINWYGSSTFTFFSYMRDFCIYTLRDFCIHTVGDFCIYTVRDFCIYTARDFCTATQRV